MMVGTGSGVAPCWTGHSVFDLICPPGPIVLLGVQPDGHDLIGA